MPPRRDSADHAAPNHLPDRPLRILQVLRAPVGGLFRHVVDLVNGQVARGHAVGMVVDSATGGERAIAMLREMEGKLALGLTRLSMSRHVGIGDLAAARHVSARIAAVAPDVVHGHGGKGGAYVRLAPTPRHAIRVYTPHGGSLHFNPRSPAGLFYLTLERILASRTELFLFESFYSAEMFHRRVGAPDGLVKVVHNGVGPDEFVPVAPASETSDLVFIGELRLLKGIDLLIEAVAVLHAQGRPVTLTVVGDGPDRALAEAKAQKLGTAVRFVGAMPARQGFALGRLVVVPSRAESLPYIVLEAIAAGRPLIATDVGDVPVIFGPYAGMLAPRNDLAGLVNALRHALDAPAELADTAAALRERVRATFSADTMVEGILGAYREAMVAREPS